MVEVLVLVETVAVDLVVVETASELVVEPGPAPARHWK